MPPSYEEMLLSPDWQEQIRQQKEAFIQGKPLDRSIVRDIIADSWERSLAFGLDPAHNVPIPASDKAVDASRKKNAALLEISHSFIDHALLPALMFRKSSITFSDELGIQLCTSQKDAGQDEFFPLGGEKMYSTEMSKGTNGIGTCIAMREVVEIFGEEHYANRGRKWVCTAAPILDNKGELRGVLHVTQPCSLYHPHTLGMVKAVAFAISGQLRLRTLWQQQQTMADLMNAGAIILSPTFDIEIINNQARTMLQITDEYLGKNIYQVLCHSARLEELLNSSVSIIDRELDIVLHSGARLSCMMSAYRQSDNGGLVLRLSETRRMRSLAVQLAGTQAAFTFDQIIGDSPAIVTVLGHARMIAARQTTVLLLGESGTGKELFAQAIHNASPRAGKPFVAVNCGALPRSLVESELFGYAQGTFTGGDKNGKPGKFELADEGTIFLDEIGDMPLDAQVALLRLLQDGEVTRVGGKTSRKVSVRVIAATNKNLQEALETHSFRADLFYRLNVFPILIPPLSERAADIGQLAQHFLSKFAISMHKVVNGFTPEALQCLQSYAWPGNVRELENIVERAVNICEEAQTVGMDCLPPYVAQRMNAPLPAGSLMCTEKSHMCDVLRQTKGNIRQSAHILGVSRGGLYVTMKRLGICVEEFR